MRQLGGEPASRAAEIQAVVHALRDGSHVLIARDGEDFQRLYCLEPEDERLVIGRSPDCDIVLDWDAAASRAHAELVRMGGGWIVVDEGLSQNGTWIGGERVAGRRRLRDGDALRCGATVLVFRAPEQGSGARTAMTSGPGTLGEVTPMQRKVLIELCRPMGKDPDAAPATNGRIAEALFLSVDAIKTHLRALYERLELDELPQNEKRVRLARIALRDGTITPRELHEGGDAGPRGG